MIYDFWDLARGDLFRAALVHVSFQTIIEISKVNFHIKILIKRHFLDIRMEIFLEVHGVVSLL